MTATTGATAEERPLAAVAYIFTWVTGIVVLLVAHKDQRYLRWNAIQAIALGAAGAVLGFLFALLTPFFFAGQLLDGTGPPWWLGYGGLGGLIGLAVFVLAIVAAVRAYRGSALRIPVLAGFADRYA